MKKNKVSTKLDSEIVAITTVYSALKDLDKDAQIRVLNYVHEKLQIKVGGLAQMENKEGFNQEAIPHSSARNVEVENDGDELEGVSAVAQKWVARNGLSSQKLSMIFSLGVDEIDLVAKVVPGKSKRERMRSVFLLKGVAAYLGTAVARFSHEQIKEACLHYDAFDSGNFAIHLKSLAAEVSGNKDSGYCLTARGLTNATEIVKSLTQ